jgi:hypothetical protein
MTLMGNVITFFTLFGGILDSDFAMPGDLASKRFQTLSVSSLLLCVVRSIDVWMQQVSNQQDTDSTTTKS